MNILQNNPAEKFLQGDGLYFIEPTGINDTILSPNDTILSRLATMTPTTADCRPDNRFDELFIRPRSNIMPLCTKMIIGFLVIYLLYKFFNLCKNNVEKLTVQDYNHNNKKKKIISSPNCGVPCDKYLNIKRNPGEEHICNKWDEQSMGPSSGLTWGGAQCNFN